MGFRFTAVKDTIKMMMPDKKLEILKAIPVPKNVRELQSFMDFCGFFSILLQNSKPLLQPLLKLIRKETEYCWGPEQQKCFETIKKNLAEASVSSFLKLVGNDKLQQMIAYADWTQSSKSVSATVFVKGYKEKKMEVAFFWGRLLSPTFDKKSPFLC